MARAFYPTESFTHGATPPRGVARGPEFQVNTPATRNLSNPSVTADADGDVVVAWQGYSSLAEGIYARRFNAAGLAGDAELRVNTFPNSYVANASVAADAGGNFVVAWLSNNQDG